MTAVGLCAVRAVHIRRPFPVSAHVRGRQEKLRHLASARLTCMHMFLWKSVWLFNLSKVSSREHCLDLLEEGGGLV